jgi:biopolymer transport protein ExbD
MASAMGARNGRAAPIVGINVTPMVDVMLVLLVILMVSAVYIVSQSLKVELPKTATSDQPASSPVAVTITKEGNYYYNQKPVSETVLIEQLRRARAKSDAASVVLTADRETYHGDVVHVIDLAKLQGISKFAINVERTR